MIYRTIQEGFWTGAKALRAGSMPASQLTTRRHSLCNSLRCGICKAGQSHPSEPLATHREAPLTPYRAIFDQWSSDPHLISRSPSDGGPTGSLFCRFLQAGGVGSRASEKIMRSEPLYGVCRSRVDPQGPRNRAQLTALQGGEDVSSVYSNPAMASCTPTRPAP